MALPQAFSFLNTSALLFGLVGGAYAGVLFTGFFTLHAGASDIEFLYAFWTKATSSLNDFVALVTPVLAFSLLGFLASYVFILRKSLRRASKTFSTVREADLSKDEFISMVLHHIRTPLTGIRWSLNEIVSRPTLPPEDKTAFQRIIGENNRALTAVDHLIEASRASTERVAYNFEIMSISLLVQRVREATLNLQAEAKEKQITLEIEVKTSERSIKVDSEKIITVLQTLVENALSYSKPGESVFIRVSEDNDSLKLEVEDSGIGIPLADQPKVFSQFFRSENAKRKDPGGFGIGLYLVKTFVAEHGGTVSFVSTEDKGTTFTVTLPIITARSEEHLEKI